MKYFQRIAQGVEVATLLHALQYQPELWGMQRGAMQPAHAGVEDIVLRWDTAEVEPPEGILPPANLLCSSTYVLKHLPQARRLALALMAQVEGEQLGRMVLTRSQPGVNVALHSDIGMGPSILQDPAFHYERYHIVLQSQPGCVFKCGDEAVFMATGEAWWFDNTQEHEVINNSGAERIHLIIDIRPLK